MLETVVNALLIIGVVLAVANVAVYSTAKWNATKSGRAMYFFAVAVVLLLLHFVAEEIWGQLWISETIVAVIFVAAMLNNLITITYKLYFAHDSERMLKRGRDA